MKKLSRITSIILALTMVIGIIPKASATLEMEDTGWVMTVPGFCDVDEEITFALNPGETYDPEKLIEFVLAQNGEIDESFLLELITNEEFNLNWVNSPTLASL